MLPLAFSSKKQPLNVLCLGAHCDDIEIGCGGTILELTSQRDIHCTWVVFCSNEVRAREAADCAESFLTGARKKNVQIHTFRDGFLPYHGSEVKETFELLKQQVSPDIIFTHYRHDKHQDHRIVSELTLNTFRNHLILEYEIPKYDGDMGTPNTYMSINVTNSDYKIKEILGKYVSQHNRNWFTEDLFKSLMRIRGMEVNSTSNFAEAFYCYKMAISD